MLAPFKVIAFAFGLLFLMLLTTGIIQFKKEPYGCLGKWDYGFREKVEVVHIGAFRMNAYPITRECPADQQYDPSKVDEALADELSQ